MVYWVGLCILIVGAVGGFATYYEYRLGGDLVISCMVGVIVSAMTTVVIAVLAFIVCTPMLYPFLCFIALVAVVCSPALYLHYKKKKED